MPSPGADAASAASVARARSSSGKLATLETSSSTTPNSLVETSEVRPADSTASSTTTRGSGGGPGGRWRRWERRRRPGGGAWRPVAARPRGAGQGAVRAARPASRGAGARAGGASRRGRAGRGSALAARLRVVGRASIVRIERRVHRDVRVDLLARHELELVDDALVVRVGHREEDAVAPHEDGQDPVASRRPRAARRRGARARSRPA